MLSPPPEIKFSSLLLKISWKTEIELFPCCLATPWDWIFCYLKIIHIFHQNYDPKVIDHILKTKQKNKGVCIHDIIRLIMMKMKMKIKNRSEIYDINRPKPRYNKYKKCLNMMLFMYIKQHLNNIWSSIQEKVKQYWGWIEKKRCLQKKCVFHMKTRIYLKYFMNNCRLIESSAYRKHCQIKCFELLHSEIVLW